MEPGAPPHFAFWDLTYAAPFGLRSTIHLNWVDSYVVNNANTVSNWAYTVVGLRFGLETRATNKLGIRPFIGIDNLMGTRYNSSTIPNAFGRRYFEPSPGREVYGGFTLGLGPF
jgi:iron complex outermembrane receptor protein